MVLLLYLKLNLLPNRLDLPPLPLPSPEEIADEKALEDWNQRHREDEKNATAAILKRSASRPRSKGSLRALLGRIRALCETPKRAPAMEYTSNKMLENVVLNTIY